MGSQTELDENQSAHQDNQSNNYQIMPAKLLHPAIDFKPEGMVVGFGVLVEGDDGPEEDTFHVVFDKNGFRVEPTNHILFFGKQKFLLNNSVSPPLVEDHWDLAKIAGFLKNPTCPTGIFHTIASTVRKYSELQHQTQYGLIAVWVIATYFAHLFQAFPFLLFIGPKETGKSKLLESINLMAFNSVKVKTITDAALCDTTEGLRGTVLIDQAEALPQNIMGTIADSYKKAGAKRRIIGHQNGRRVIKEYSGYGPKAFATTKALDADLNDRCCEIITQRSLQPMPDILGYEPEWEIIRDMCYRFLLLEWRNIQAAYVQLPFTGNRKGELWRPLEAILRVLKVSQVEFETIKQAFERGTERTRDRLSNAEETLFEVLLKQAQHQQNFEMTVSDILDKMKPILIKSEFPTPQGLGNKIALFNLADDKKKRTRKKMVHYLFSADRVKDLASRYMN